MEINTLLLSKYVAGVLLLLSRIVFAQEYTYDAAGNMSGDSNKEIASIHYNHLNLVDSILYADGRKMIYTYSAGGQKLRERSILGNGTVKQKRDYCGAILYRNDSLTEIIHETGRIVPAQPGNTNAWEYQYHLTDHLGNVRSVLTSKEEESARTATFENVNTGTEQASFLRYQGARKINSLLFDHTKTGTTFYSERLNGSVNEKYGIGCSLSVMPGDVVKLEVYAKYVDANNTHWTQALTTLLTQIASGIAPAGTVVDGPGYVTNGSAPFPFAGLNGTNTSTGTGPKAYMNWLVFDRNYVLKDAGYRRVSAAAKENGNNVAHERLFTEFTIREAGYVYMYLSNEETKPVDVFFDDVRVNVTNSAIVQESDYDPFGLTFNEYARENTEPGNFLYNGKELQRDFDLNWYYYGARMYDAALGRWHTVDSLSEKYVSWSPYNYVTNNPMKYVDPDGKDKTEAIVFFRILSDGRESAGFTVSNTTDNKTGSISTSATASWNKGSKGWIENGNGALTVQLTKSENAENTTAGGGTVTTGGDFILNVSDGDSRGAIGVNIKRSEITSVSVGKGRADITFGIDANGKDENGKSVLKINPALTLRQLPGTISINKTGNVISVNGVRPVRPAPGSEATQRVVEELEEHIKK